MYIICIYVTIRPIICFLSMAMCTYMYIYIYRYLSLFRPFSGRPEFHPSESTEDTASERIGREKTPRAVGIIK